MNKQSKQEKIKKALLPGFIIFLAFGLIVALTFWPNKEEDITGVEETEQELNNEGAAEPEKSKDNDKEAKEEIKEEPEEEIVVEKEAADEEEKKEKTLKQIVYGFLGTPYELGPLGEGEDEEILRTDVFDCTTLVLVSAAYFASNGGAPEEMMKKANYYPSEKVSYETRLHFSSYRNQVSPLFKDITRKIGGEKTKQKKIILNREREEEGRIIDIGWEKEIVLEYIEKQDVPEIISELPSEAGVAFIVEGDEKIGLDIRHEGFLFDKKTIVHASSQKGEVSEDNFLELLINSHYDGVSFFIIESLF